jgi:hypothetical protein
LIILLVSEVENEILSNMNVYRPSEQVIIYNASQSCLERLAGNDYEFTGRVVKAHIGDACIDPVLTESFCQDTDIYVNMMTTGIAELSQRGIFTCKKIDQWMRSPKFGPFISLTKTCEVFALHHQNSEDRYISDVFVFDP